MSEQARSARTAWALYPAIDILGGACVRLRQGNFDRPDEYNSDPIDQATAFATLGARCMHIVDLDGAREGSTRNRAIIVEIIRRCSGVFVQVGGGIRDEESVDGYLEAGAGAVIIGTACLTRPDWVNDMAVRYPGRICISLDARRGRLAVSGWQEQSEALAVDVAKRFAYPEISAIIYTDIDRDGLLGGINLQACLAMASAQEIPVIVSGGVASMEDVRRVHQCRRDNLAGVIMGRALYTGALDLQEAIRGYDWS